MRDLVFNYKETSILAIGNDVLGHYCIQAYAQDPETKEFTNFVLSPKSQIETIEKFKELVSYALKN